VRHACGCGDCRRHLDLGANQLSTLPYLARLTGLTYVDARVGAAVVDARETSGGRVVQVLECAQQRAQHTATILGWISPRASVRGVVGVGVRGTFGGYHGIAAIRYLNLETNSLWGVIPSEWSLLTNLEYVSATGVWHFLPTGVHSTRLRLRCAAVSAAGRSGCVA
jgi:hypothetical protein